MDISEFAFQRIIWPLNTGYTFSNITTTTQLTLVIVWKKNSNQQHIWKILHQFQNHFPSTLNIECYFFFILDRTSYFSVTQIKNNCIICILHYQCFSEMVLQCTQIVDDLNAPSWISRAITPIYSQSSFSSYLPYRIKQNCSLK